MKVLENVLNINELLSNTLLPVLILVLLRMVFLIKMYILMGTNFSELLKFAKMFPISLQKVVIIKNVNNSENNRSDEGEACAPQKENQVMGSGQK